MDANPNPNPSPNPHQVGASDVPLLEFCNEQRVPAAAISPELDVWTHTRRRLTLTLTLALTLTLSRRWLRT